LVNEKSLKFFLHSCLLYCVREFGAGSARVDGMASPVPVFPWLINRTTHICFFCTDIIPYVESIVWEQNTCSGMQLFPLLLVFFVVLV